MKIYEINCILSDASRIIDQGPSKATDRRTALDRGRGRTGDDAQSRCAVLSDRGCSPVRRRPCPVSRGRLTVRFVERRQRSLPAGWPRSARRRRSNCPSESW